MEQIHENNHEHFSSSYTCSQDNENKIMSRKESIEKEGGKGPLVGFVVRGEAVIGAELGVVVAGLAVEGSDVGERVFGTSVEGFAVGSAVGRAVLGERVFGENVGEFVSGLKVGEVCNDRSPRCKGLPHLQKMLP